MVHKAVIPGCEVAEASVVVDGSSDIVVTAGDALLVVEDEVS